MGSEKWNDRWRISTHRPNNQDRKLHKDKNSNYRRNNIFISRKQYIEKCISPKLLHKTSSSYTKHYYMFTPWKFCPNTCKKDELKIVGS